MPEAAQVIGAARGDMDTDGYRAMVREALLEFSDKAERGDEVIDGFLKHIDYAQVDAQGDDGWDDLRGKLREGMSKVLDERGIAHSFAGHTSMSGLFFAPEAPKNYRDWKSSDYSFYDAMAQVLHDLGILCEPDSREPWFICESHDEACLKETLDKFAIAVDETLEVEATHRATDADDLEPGECCVVHQIHPSSLRGS